MQTKDTIRELVDGIAGRLESLRDSLYDFAELPYREFCSSDLLIRELERNGFEVVSGAAGIPTCFYGAFTHGEGGMTAGFLGEYDALDGLSQEAGCTVHRPVRENAPGHGCGHCCLGVGSLGAAIVLKEYLVQTDLPGTVVYYGCPAEEGAGAKQFMARAGLFDRCDFIYTWHPSDKNEVDSAHMNAIMGANFYFTGRSSHAGAAPHLGRSALDAAELMSVGCNYLREHVIPEARIHYAYIDAGGTAPNVVQDRAVVRYEVRAPYVYQVKELYARVVNVARGAAMMTETQVRDELAMAFTEYLPNISLAPVASRAMRDIGGPVWTDGDQELGHEYLLSFPTETQEEIKRAMRTQYGAGWEESWTHPMDSTVRTFDVSDIRPLAGSTDVGDVGYTVPCVSILVATCARGTVGHTWQFAGQAGSVLGTKGMLAAAKMLALAAVYTFGEPERVRKAKEEVKERNGGAYTCPLPDSVLPPIETY